MNKALVLVGGSLLGLSALLWWFAGMMEVDEGVSQPIGRVAALLLIGAAVIEHRRKKREGKRNHA